MHELTLFLFCSVINIMLLYPKSSRNNFLPTLDARLRAFPSPAFTHWQAKRECSGGWSPEMQRAFIHELTCIGAVGAAARAVGEIFAVGF